MPQVIQVLKLLFISYNIFIMIAGVVIVTVDFDLLSPPVDSLDVGDDVRQTHPLTPGTHTKTQEGRSNIHINLYIFGSVTMGIAILGGYGGHKKNPVALIVYLVFMVIGGLLLRAGVPAAVIRPKLESEMSDRWRSLLPLDLASDHIKKQVEAQQTSLHCCGLFSYKDWEENIPDSCVCNQEQLEERCQTVSYRNFLLNLFWQKKSVFKQTCFPLIMASVTTNITLAVDATLYVLVMLGSVLSLLLIYQMFNTDRQNAPLSVPVMFIEQPPDYQQLYNMPE